MPRGRALKNPNGYGSVVKLSGKRRNPFESQYTDGRTLLPYL